MRPDELKEIIHIRPFRPVRLHLSDGTTFDIRHPEMALLSRSIIAVATKARNGIAEEIEYISLLHIVRAEHINGDVAHAERQEGQ